MARVVPEPAVVPVSITDWVTLLPVALAASELLIKEALLVPMASVVKVMAEPVLAALVASVVDWRAATRTDPKALTGDVEVELLPVPSPSVVLDSIRDWVRLLALAVAVSAEFCSDALLPVSVPVDSARVASLDVAPTAAVFDCNPPSAADVRLAAESVSSREVEAMLPRATAPELLASTATEPFRVLPVASVVFVVSARPVTAAVLL